MQPGTLIKTGLEFMGIDPASCNCVERAAQMDEWGVDGCRENMETIVGWFVAEGRRHDVVASQTPQFRNIVREAVVLVLNRSETLLSFESAAFGGDDPVEAPVDAPALDEDDDEPQTGDTEVVSDEEVDGLVDSETFGRSE